MSIEQEITRLVDAKASLKVWLEARSIASPDNALLPELVALLDSIPESAGTAAVTITNNLASSVEIAAPETRTTVAANGSVTVSCPIGGMVAVNPGRYYCAPTAGGVLIENASGGTTVPHTPKNGQFVFIRPTAPVCTIVTSKTQLA